MYSFPDYLETVCCSMSSSNCCFLTYIQISQEAGQVVWYSYLLKNFPQFVVIHTVKRIFNKAEIDVFWNSFAFLMTQQMLAIGSLVPLPFLNPSWTSGSSQFTYCWSLTWRILSNTLLACEMCAILAVLFPVFKEISTLFSIVPLLACIPTNGVRMFTFLHTLSSICCL